MTWGRWADTSTQDAVFEHVSFAARWHYHALIEFCCRTDRYDGVIRAVDAQRCSDVDDPMTALAELAAAGLVDVDETARTVRVVRIEQHIQPEHLRDPARKKRQREKSRRWREHRKGNHFYCLPENCPGAVTGHVTGHVGSGRDGYGETPKQPRSEELQNGNGAVTGAVTGADR